MGARPQSACVDVHCPDDWRGLIFSAFIRKSAIARSSLSHIHVVDSGILPSALRANADGVIQNRSRRFCRDIPTSTSKRPGSYDT